MIILAWLSSASLSLASHQLCLSLLVLVYLSQVEFACYGLFESGGQLHQLPPLFGLLPSRPGHLNTEQANLEITVARFMI